MAELIKTSEKLIVWMHRSRYSLQNVSKALAISENALNDKLRTNQWEEWELKLLKALGL